MRLITIALAALLILIQYPLWLGKGSWLLVADMRDQVEATRLKTEQLKARNAMLESEVRDLRDGLGAVDRQFDAEPGRREQFHRHFLVKVVVFHQQNVLVHGSGPFKWAG